MQIWRLLMFNYVWIKSQKITQCSSMYLLYFSSIYREPIYTFLQEYSMNIAIKLNTIVQSVWPDASLEMKIFQTDKLINRFEEILQTLPINDLSQVMEICSHKTLFFILQKSELMIKKFTSNQSEFLRLMSNLFESWTLSAYHYTLKRSFDVYPLEFYLQSSVSKFIGKVLKQMSKSNTSTDWSEIFIFLVKLGQKSKFYQILIIQGYFDEIQNMQTQIEQFDKLREIFRNFEYQLVREVTELVIKNVSECKDTLQMVEIQKLQKGLSIMGEQDKIIENSRTENSRTENSRIENPYEAQIKYLKYNFQVLKKIINFDYEIYFTDDDFEQIYPTSHYSKKCISFPDYIIKPFLENSFFTQLYQIAEMLLNFSWKANQARVTFLDIILDLINKIIKTKIFNFQVSSRQRFIKQVLEGQTRLMRVFNHTFKFQSHNLVKILKGNLKFLKNTDIMDLIVFKQGENWLIQMFKLIQSVINMEQALNLDNYLSYRALNLAKQIVFQTIIYEMSSIYQNVAKEIISFGLKIQQNFLFRFISSTTENTDCFVGSFYSLQDLRSKRDRYFLNIKILCQIYLQVFNKSLRTIISNINNVKKAINFLFFMSYLIGTDFFNQASFYYVCTTQDIRNFRKLAIGNGYVLMSQLMNRSQHFSDSKYPLPEVIFLFIQKILKEYFQNHTQLTMGLYPSDIYVQNLSHHDYFSQLSNAPKVITNLLIWTLRIVNIRLERHSKCYQTQVQTFLQAFISNLKLLISQSERLQNYQIISIQCELNHEFVDFKSRFRKNCSNNLRKYLSQITLLLQKQPDKSIAMHQNTEKLAFVIQRQFKQISKVMENNYMDWIGCSYQISGFLNQIEHQNIYLSTTRLLGADFLGKILQSCLEDVNQYKIKLLFCISDSFLTYTQDMPVRLINQWLPFVKQIFSAWTQSFRIVVCGKYDAQSWDQHSYTAVLNMLTNQNFNFYLFKRSKQLQATFKVFVSEMINFLTHSLGQKSKCPVKETKLFKVIKQLFDNFCQFFILNEDDQLSRDFFILAENLIILIKTQLRSINNRKLNYVRMFFQALRPLSKIMSNFNGFRIKYGHKVRLQQNIQQFVVFQKAKFLQIENQLYIFRGNYEKYMKFEEEKYRQHQIDLLECLQREICQLYHKQKTDKMSNHQSTMSNSDKQPGQDLQNVMNCQNKADQIRINLNQLQKQLIWFDIEDKTLNIDY